MPVESYEDDDEEQEGPRSSFGTYLAEGDALFKQSEYKKALESYSLALELQPNDKTCLVARSKCYLKLGDPQKALQDAEDALTEDKEFNKGLYRKAEALYCMGDFEYALMYYHRGHKLRPELDEFRLGIQKAQEAIDNSIGSAAKIKLENKGDLSFFTKQDDMVNKKRGGYLKQVTNNKKLKPLANRNKEVKPPAPSKKTVKQLLGELYSDKEYFEKLMEDEAFIKSRQNSQIYELVQGGLNYLETRTEFWRQQKPLYARKKEKAKYNLVRKKTKPSISKYVLKQLEEVDQALSCGDSDRSLRLAQKLLKSVEAINKVDLPNKPEVIANIHSCIGNAYIEMNQLAKALRHHEKDLQLSKQSKLVDGESRALDNVGRVHARMGNFKKAVASWTEKLPLVKASLESTWLFHEIGRCHLELGNNKKAQEFGQKSLAAGKDCEDQIWQLNAIVLIAQSQVKLGNVFDAIETFSNGLELAIGLGDSSAQSAISKALTDLQRRSSQASGRYTSHSEDEESPRIKSDMDDRAEADVTPTGSRSSSIKSSPMPDGGDDENCLSLRDQNRTEKVHEDSNEERTGDEIESDTISESNKDNEITTHVNLTNGSETTDNDHDNKDANEVLNVATEADKIEVERLPAANNVSPGSLKEEDEHRDGDTSKVSTTDDKTEKGNDIDKTSYVDTGYDKSEQEVTPLHTSGGEANPRNESEVEENPRDENEADQATGKESEREDSPKGGSDNEVTPQNESETEETMHNESENVSNNNEKEDTPQFANVTDNKSYVESDQPLTTEDLNRQSSAEKLDSVDISYSESTENITSPTASIANATSLAESIENITSPAVSNEHFISPILSAEGTTSEEIISEQVMAQGTENISSPAGSVEDVTASTENVPTENITSPGESTENMESLTESTENVTSPRVSTDVISETQSTENITSENVTFPDASSENITSPAQSTENMESLAESTEDVTSPRVSTDVISETQSTENITSENVTSPAASIENVSGETSSVVVVDQVSLAQDTVYLASSSGSIIGDEGTNVTHDTITSEVTPLAGEEISSGINSEEETPLDLSQVSNIEELPMDSSRATPDITISEDTSRDAGTIESTSGDIIEGAPDVSTTEEIPRDTSLATLDSTTDEIPRDISQTTVDMSFEEETTRDIGQDSQEVSTTIHETTEDLSQVTDEENANVHLPDEIGTDLKNESEKNIVIMAGISAKDRVLGGVGAGITT